MPEPHPGVGPAVRLLQATRDVSPSYVAGFDCALWDYNDANGLRNKRVVRLQQRTRLRLAVADGVTGMLGPGRRPR